MFDNVGRQIKTLSKFLLWIGIIISVIIGFFYAFNDTATALLGLIVLIFGCLGSYIFSLLLYGFGQLIENSDALVEISKRNNKSTELPVFVNSEKKENVHKWRCSKCGNMISESICPHCSNEIEIKENLQ